MSSFYLWLRICMLLIHETIRLACRTAALSLYTCVYIVFAISFSGIYPFKRLHVQNARTDKVMSFYNHHHLVKTFINTCWLPYFCFA